MSRKFENSACEMEKVHYDLSEAPTENSNIRATTLKMVRIMP